MNKVLTNIDVVTISPSTKRNRTTTKFTTTKTINRTGDAKSMKEVTTALTTAALFDIAR
ncbi:hypothetical protein CHS0354_001609 [Potamilus streckersoni]|uniref:Uncharacterized protein n=1 Tax=Potamilus streckersoni TaxID=2493646 RepID=A0AAE0W6G8_9BIVA|nr:hypothetical protein CHS0354_001609 [Potamilus streckersoni]